MKSTIEQRIEKYGPDPAVRRHLLQDAFDDEDTILAHIRDDHAGRDLDEMTHGELLHLHVSIHRPKGVAP